MITIQKAQRAYRTGSITKQAKHTQNNTCALDWRLNHASSLFISSDITQKAFLINKQFCKHQQDYKSLATTLGTEEHVVKLGSSLFQSNR